MPRFYRLSFVIVAHVVSDRETGSFGNRYNMFYGLKQTVL